MTKKEITGIVAFAKALNSSWSEDKIFVSATDDYVEVSGVTEFVLNFVSSVTNLFCAVCPAFVLLPDDKLVYRLF